MERVVLAVVRVEVYSVDCMAVGCWLCFERVMVSVAEVDDICCCCCCC